MFGTGTAPEPTHDDVGAMPPADGLIPLTELALTLPTPDAGWPAFLAARDVDVKPDDLGRDAITRSAAKMLISMHRAAEERNALLRQDAERQAVEDDKRRRALIWKGLPADRLPVGVSAAAALAQAAHDAAPRRRSLTEEVFDGGGMTFHSLPRGDE